jgi:hypothetical protein
MAESFPFFTLPAYESRIASTHACRASGERSTYTKEGPRSTYKQRGWPRSKYKQREGPRSTFKQGGGGKVHL